jgi:hypothetical protein
MPTLTKDEVLRLLGGTPESVAQELTDFADAASVLSSDQPRLIDEHPDEWVGVYKGDIIAAKELPALMAQLTNKGIPPENAIVRFIDREEKTLLLF